MTVEWILTPGRLSGAAALLGGYAAMCLAVAAKVRRRRRAEEAENAEPQGRAQAPAVLVVYASQTGQAEALARATARMLVDGGLQVRLLPVDKLTPAVLQQHVHSLWLLSTTGEGDAPDHALGFVQQLLPKQTGLAGHKSLVLALGDHEYEQFCAFGVAVHAWLQACGAHSELICVDNMNPQSLQAWQAQVERLRQDLRGAAAQESDWLQTPVGQPFVLSRRHLLNPGSEGGPLYLLEWTPQAGELPQWQSGDLVSLCVPAAADRPRDYSIASVTAEGCLQLLVRQSTREDGSPGLASDWLCRGMEIGTALPLTLRAHSSFRLGDNAERPLMLIGNGSGLAGLLSHIKARVQQGRSDQWLVFGERNPQHDALCADKLQAWRQQGQLERLDLAWSRQAQGPRYVQDLLRSHADEVKRWVERGAAIYVCGSRSGMGQGVHLALQAILGPAMVEELLAAGRYRRDVY
ncbi:sulfite reductase subunit alpha [Comamonas guangdongensis]|uniref:NADPH--hemoprotein reductase n=1 Tax=Comamonas guangdongensis TaxID=510515 RepID=A0ABV3ZYQ8_9BURK